jgi:hypothetical protein
VYRYLFAAAMAQGFGDQVLRALRDDDQTEPTDLWCRRRWCRLAVQGCNRDGKPAGRCAVGGLTGDRRPALGRQTNVATRDLPGSSRVGDVRERPVGLEPGADRAVERGVQVRV